jgi:dTDP-4-amino-4,6-dideoxygalactose transaminase
VIVPAFTFVATAHAMAWQGIRPVFCDVDRVTHQLDPAQVEAALTETTTGILAAHTWGRPSDVAALSAVARRNGIQLMFDGAPAFGATVDGVFVGSFGKAEIVSFHATKVVNSGEGGAILTNDDEVAARARTMRSFGFVDNDEIVSLGTNAKMSELSAAMGISSLERFDHFRDVNERNFRQYEAALEGVSGVSVLPYAAGEEANYNNVVIEIDAECTGITRDLVLRMLAAENVLARRYFYPGCHRMEPYRSRQKPHPTDFPVTDEVASRVLSLPTGTDIAPSDVDLVVELVAGLVEHGAEATAWAARAGLRDHIDS